MTLRQIRYFIRIAETGSYTASARILGISQPALGLQIKKLEDHLGVRLFERHSRGLRLTPAGQAFLAEVPAIFEALARAEAAAQKGKANRGPNAGIAGDVSLGVMPEIARSFVPDLLRVCGDSFPKIKLSIFEGTMEDVTALVAEGILTLAFSVICNPVKGLQTTPMFREPSYLVGPHRDNDGGVPTVEFCELAHYPLVMHHRRFAQRRFYEAAARRSGVTLDVRYEFDAVAPSADILNELNCYMLCALGLFQSSIERGRFMARRIVNPDVFRNVSLLRRVDVAPTAAAQVVEDLARDLVVRRVESDKSAWLPATNSDSFA